VDLLLPTAGEHLAVWSARRWVTDLVHEAAGAEVAPVGRPTVFIEIEASRSPFPTAGFDVLGRGAWHRAGEVVVRDACTSGFDLRLNVEDDGPHFAFRFRPPRPTRLANAAMRSRFVLLVRAVLAQYPALWWAGVRRRAPLHAGGVRIEEANVLLAGPGGVGKTSLLVLELAAGGAATADNMVVSDGATLWGLAEPLRFDGGGGRRMPHGRGEAELSGRLPSLTPDRAVLLRRGSAPEPSVRASSEGSLARALVAGTYMAGELRRYWGLAATLALGSGHGQPHPAVAEVAAQLAGRLPSVEVMLACRPGWRLSELLAQASLAETRPCRSAS
jgi:hypothetical protein